MTVDLSIIIVNWNTCDLLRDCLASVPAAIGELTAEVIVVDNASTDNSTEMVRGEFPGTRLIESGGNLGFSRANNLALPETNGEMILLLNPDTVCPPDSLYKLVTFLRTTPEAGIVGPTLIDSDGRPIITCGNFPRSRYHWFGFLDPKQVWLPGRWRHERFVHIPEVGDPNREVDYVAGACLLIRREVLDRIGNLDEQFFMYFEETDWCWRTREAGWKVYLFNGAQVVHLEGRAAEQVSHFSRIQFQHSYRLFVMKHHGPGRVAAFRVAQFAEFATKAVLRYLVPRERKQNRALARHYWTIARLQLTSRLVPPRP